MRNFILIITLIGLVSSCSNTKRISSGGFIQKRKYTKGFYFNNKKPVHLTSEVEQKIPQIAKKTNTIESVKDEIKTTELQPEINLISDTVKVVLKNGETYIGVKTDETEKGIVITLENSRAVYFRKDEIESITVIDPNEEVTGTKLSPIIEDEGIDDYAIPDNSNSNFRNSMHQDEINKEGKKLHMVSKLAIMFLLIALLIGVLSFFLIMAGGILIDIGAYLIMLAMYSYAAAVALSIIGKIVAHNRESLYDKRKSTSVMFIVSIPMLFLIGLWFYLW